MTRYLALLRGINVGGKNLIRMTDLKACFEEQGLRSVTTYIQSGNVLFSSGEARGPVTRLLERVLSARFHYRATIVLRTLPQMRGIVQRAPAGFGSRRAQYRYDVIFLKEPVTAQAVIRSVPRREGVDRAFAGSGVLYCSRLIARAAQSRLSRVVSLPAYQSMTIRTWSTATKLLQLMEEGP